MGLAIAGSMFSSISMMAQDAGKPDQDSMDSLARVFKKEDRKSVV